MFDTNMMARWKNTPDRTACNGAVCGLCTDGFVISNGSCVISSELVTTTNTENNPRGALTAFSSTTLRFCRVTRRVRHATTQRRDFHVTLQTSGQTGLCRYGGGHRHLRRRRRVVAGRRVSLCLTTTPTTLEGQPNMLLDEGADVAPVVKVTTALALPSICRL